MTLAACWVATELVARKASAIEATASTFTRRRSPDDTCGGRYGRCSATLYLPAARAAVAARFLDIAVALHAAKLALPVRPHLPSHFAALGRQSELFEGI